jgi:hypothetical protein
VVSVENIQRIALSLKGVKAVTHFGAVSFKARKIFAVLREEGRVTVGLHPDDQGNLLALHPDALEPVAGKSGGAGWTYAKLATIDEDLARRLLTLAHEGAAPR